MQCRMVQLHDIDVCIWGTEGQFCQQTNASMCLYVYVLDSVTCFQFPKIYGKN